MFSNLELKFDIDQELLNKKATEFAEKAMIAELESYYSSYSSPFRKKIKEALDAKEISVHFDLPDVLSHINKVIEAEHSSIVDSFLKLTVVDDVRNSLRLQPKEISFSDFLQGVMESDYNFQEDYLDEYSVEVEDKTDRTQKITISYKNKDIEITVQTFDDGKSYKFCREPYYKKENYVLRRIESYLLSLALSGTYITSFNVDSFEELFYND